MPRRGSVMGGGHVAGAGSRQTHQRFDVGQALRTRGQPEVVKQRGPKRPRLCGGVFDQCWHDRVNQHVLGARARGGLLALEFALTRGCVLRGRNGARPRLGPAVRATVGPPRDVETRAPRTLESEHGALLFLHLNEWWGAGVAW